MNKIKYYLAGIFCLCLLFTASHFVNAASSISGTILKETGTPIANLVVSAYNNDHKFNGLTDENGDYTIDITGTAAGNYTIQTTGATTVYDGIYPNSLGSHLEYFYTQSTIISVVDGINQANINFTLKQHGMLSGNITNSSGEPLYRADISLRNKNDYYYAYSANDSTNELGNFYITPVKSFDYLYFQNAQGFYSAQIYAAGYLPKYVDNIQILDNQTITLNAVLTRNSYVSGQITNKKGTPLSNIIVQSYKLGSTDNYSYVLTDSNGNYQIEIGNVSGYYGYDDFDEYTAKGKYTIEVSPNDASGYVKKTKNITISSDESNLSNVNFKLTSKKDSLSGKIKTTKKKAINGATIQIYLLKDPTVYAQSITDSSGSYSFPNLAKGNYRLSIYKSGYASKEIAKLKIKGNKIKNYKLAASGVISGYVFDSVTKKPLNEIMVRLINSDLTAETNTYGYYKINYVPTGKRKIFVKEIAYAEQFYSKATDSAKAKKIKVKKGKETKNVNFYLNAYSRIYK